MSMVTAPEIERTTARGAMRRASVAAPGRHEDTSAGKALALLDAFSGQLAVVGVTELAARADIPKSTAHRLLTVLVGRGYIRRVGDRYCLTEHMFEIGSQVRSCRPSGIRDIATPYLGELFAQTRQTVHLAVLAGTDVLYLDKVAGRDAAPCPTSIGARRPAYATALGKALLAFSDPSDLAANLQVPMRRFTARTIVGAGQLEVSLERVRREGISTDREELRPGVNCIAAAIRDPRTMRSIAAVSVCSTSPSVERRYQNVLMRTVDELSRHCVTAV